MELIKKIEITKIKNNEKTNEKDLIIQEIPLTILINNQELITLLCTPCNLEYLAIGFLAAEGLINDISQLKDINIGKNGNYINIEMEKNFQIPTDFFQRRIIGSGCGKNSYLYNRNDLNCKMIQSNIQINHSDILNLMTEFQKKSFLFSQTGGVHSSALCSLKKIDFFAEDIGRHNAIDKIFGECLMKNVETKDKIILTSGRISSEILLKVVKRNISIIISRSAPTDLAINIAEKMKITLIGFVRGNRMNIYTSDFRVL